MFVEHDSESKGWGSESVERKRARSTPIALRAEDGKIAIVDRNRGE